MARRRRGATDAPGLGVVVALPRDGAYGRVAHPHVQRPQRRLLVGPWQAQCLTQQVLAQVGAMHLRAGARAFENEPFE